MKFAIAFSVSALLLFPGVVCGQRQVPIAKGCAVLVASVNPLDRLGGVVTAYREILESAHLPLERLEAILRTQSYFGWGPVKSSEQTVAHDALRVLQQYAASANIDTILLHAALGETVGAHLHQLRAGNRQTQMAAWWTSGSFFHDPALEIETGLQLHALTFTRDGSAFFVAGAASGSTSRTLAQWELASTKTAAVSLSTPAWEGDVLALSSDGQLLFTGVSSAGIRVRTTDFVEVDDLRNPLSAVQLNVSGNGRYASIKTLGGSTELRVLKPNGELGAVLNSAPSEFFLPLLGFAPWDEHYLTKTSGNRIAVCSLQKGCVHSVDLGARFTNTSNDRFRKKGTPSLAAHPTEPLLAVAANHSWDVRVLDWRAPQRATKMEDPSRVLPAFNESGIGLAFSPDGASLFALTSSGHALVWDVDSATLLQVWQAQEPFSRGTPGILFTPDGKNLVTFSGEKGVVRFWSLEAGK